MKQNTPLLQDIIPTLLLNDLLLASDADMPQEHNIPATIGNTISDVALPGLEWCSTLSESLQYNIDRQGILAIAPPQVTCHRNNEIRLPQMANRALSENWLLKEMGDMHWELLSRGLEQKSSEFADSTGNRLLAAFVRINYTISPLSSFMENEVLDMEGEIKKYGSHAYFSSVKGNCNEKSLQASLLTSFSQRKDNDNGSMLNGKPGSKTDHIGALEKAPDCYTEHRAMSKGRLSELNCGGHNFRITDTALHTILHNINPYYEINGVGLLYFAVYPVIADRCVAEYCCTNDIIDYNAAYHTTFRDIFYFANCNPDDRIIINLNTMEQIGDHTLKTTVSMYRESDGKLMARVFTVKTKS